MKRHLLAVVCVGAFLAASVAWTQDRSRLIEAPNQDPFSDPAPNRDAFNDLGPNGEEATNPVGEDALREQLLRLVEEQVELMNLEELEEALPEVQDEIGELQAERKLEEARRILSSIVQEHVGTDGAAKAQHMLHAAAESQTGAHFAIVEPEESSSVHGELSEPELRQQLLQFAEEKAQLMDRDALQRELAEVQDGIVELQALRRLEEARRILSSIVEEQEGTEGAGRAQRMLDADTPPFHADSDPFFSGNPI